jgi:hypothetical protein
LIFLIGYFQFLSGKCFSYLHMGTFWKHGGFMERLHLIVDDEWRRVLNDRMDDLVKRVLEMKDEKIDIRAYMYTHKLRGFNRMELFTFAKYMAKNDNFDSWRVDGVLLFKNAFSYGVNGTSGAGYYTDFERLTFEECGNQIFRRMNYVLYLMSICPQLAEEMMMWWRAFALKQFEEVKSEKRLRSAVPNTT